MSGDRTVRDAMAETIREFDAATGAGIPDDELADALLPVVEAECRRRAAEELRAAAAALKWLIVTDEIGSPMDTVRDLRDRADAIDGRT